MAFSIEQLSTLERRLKGDIAWDAFAPRVQKELQVAQRKAKIHGFRPGKAPLSLIDREYGPTSRVDAARTVMSETLEEAMTTEKLSLAAYPHFHLEPIEVGQAVQFHIDFEVLPEVEPKDIQGASIERVVADVTDADVDETLLQLRKQMHTYEPSEKAAAQGDKIAASLTVAVDGAESETYPNFEVTLGEGRMIPGFEDALLGVKAGEIRTFTVNFPEAYQHKPYAGKPGQFTAEVSQILTEKLPELDDAFAVNYGIAEGTVDALRKELRQELTRELNWKLQQLLKDKVFDALYKHNPIEVPASQVKQESVRLLRNTFSQYTKHLPKAQAEQLFKNLDSSLMADEAKKRVTLSYVVEALVKQYDLKADPEQVRALIELRASMYNERADIIQNIMHDPKLMEEYESAAIEDLLVNRLLENAKVTEIKQSFTEVMRPAKPEADLHAGHDHDHDHHDHDHVHEEEQTS